jgi:hypothetical protein
LLRSVRKSDPDCRIVRLALLSLYKGRHTRPRDFSKFVEILNHAQGQIERVEFEAKIARIILEDIATRCAVNLRAGARKGQKPSSRGRR